MKSAKIKIYLLVSILAILAFSYFGTKIFIGNILPVIAQTSQPGVGGGALCVGANGAGVAVVGGAGTTCSPQASFDISTSSTSNGVLFRVAPSSSATADFLVSNNGTLTVGGTGSISTTTGITGLFIPAGWVSAGTFGSNIGGGNYSFPGILAVNTSSPYTGFLAPAFQVYGWGEFYDTQDSKASTIITGNNGQGGIIMFSSENGYLTYLGNSSAGTLFTANKNGTPTFGVDQSGNVIVANTLSVGTTTTSTATLWVTNASSTNALVVAPSGNVGIGTTSPAYKLDVAGIVNATDFYKNGQSFSSSQWTSVTGGIYYLGNVGIGTSTVSYPLFVSTSTDTLFAIQRTGASSPTIFKQGTDSGFVINNGGSDVLTIKSGNVGIGTTNPQAGLDINKGTTNNLALALRSSGPGWGSGIQFINATSGAKNYGIYAGSDSKLHFADVSSSTDRMVISSSGNVGIGTTVPGANLEIDSNVASGYVTPLHVFAPGLSTTNYVQMRLGVAASPYNSDEIRFYYAGNGSTSNRLDLGLYGTTGLSILGNGNVGIGTTTPTQALTIYNGNVLLENWGNGYGIGIGGTGNGGSQAGMYMPINTLDLRFQTNSTDRMTILNNGNVGIGTTAPSYTLDVNGTIRAQSGLIIPAVTSDPSSPVNGQMWLRTDL